ncbi:nacrein-like protein F [Hibiscus syriacus]|uniref:nacrein-like protein F n=1 Tax=Hibiscus syriacus TaxID=106335 RepID=UPI00192337D1|nr:nacrein-like protein F [Hibiscus syriacus]
MLKGVDGIGLTTIVGGGASMDGFGLTIVGGFCGCGFGLVTDGDGCGFGLITGGGGDDTSGKGDNGGDDGGDDDNGDDGDNGDNGDGGGGSGDDTGGEGDNGGDDNGDDGDDSDNGDGGGDCHGLMSDGGGDDGQTQKQYVFNKIKVIAHVTGKITVNQKQELEFPKDLNAAPSRFLLAKMRLTACVKFPTPSEIVARKLLDSRLRLDNSGQSTYSMFSSDVRLCHSGELFKFSQSTMARFFKVLVHPRRSHWDRATKFHKCPTDKDCRMKPPSQ